MKILFVTLSNVGDVVLTLPGLDLLREAFPGAELTVMEAFQFLMSNWMPRDVIADLTFERPDLVKPFELPPGGPGLN